MKLFSASFLRAYVLGASALSAVPFVSANQSPTDIAREKIIIFSREGDAQLQQAVGQLQALYARTQDAKVRDDLIALYLRTGQSAQALQVCPECRLQQRSESELENLGKAARNEKKFSESYAFYQQLAKKYPQNPNGLLGSALVASELHDHAAAQKALAQFKKRFGQTPAFNEAQSYVFDTSESDMPKLGRWQRELAANPKNTELAQKLYRLAAKYHLRPLQQRLMAQYPELFNEKDKRWLEHDDVIVSAKIASNNLALKRTFTELGQLLQKLPADNPLYQQTVEDHFTLGVRLNQLKAVEQDFEYLRTQENLPEYVQEAFGDYWAKSASPHKALAQYQKIAVAQENAKRPVASGLLLKIASAASDAGEFALAQTYLEQISNNQSINDYTHTTRVANPDFDSRYFALARLAAWRGNRGLAEQMIDARALEQTPGDPWVLLEKASFERQRLNFDDAQAWIERASYFFTSEDQKDVRYAKAELALAKGDLASAQQLIDGFNELEREEAQSLIESNELAHAGRIVGSVSLQHRTSAPVPQGNESAQDYAIYSPKTAAGHDVYVRYAQTHSPVSSETLKARFVGAGTELNFYPLSLNLEAGKGITLNKRGYVLANLKYELNQHWDFSLNGHYNGMNVPARAAAQNVYSRGGGAALSYSYADWLRMGTGIYYSRFTDGNLRRDLNFWAELQTFKHDRWTLVNNFRLDHSKNKAIASADYFNPAKALSFEGGADLSYYQPLDYGMVLTHHLKGSLGAYKQQAQAQERTWSVSYGHEWRIAKKYGISYEFGRKKNIYDGAAEYNNYGSLNFSLFY